MKNNLRIIFLFLSVSATAYAETPKQVTKGKQVWVGDFTKIKLNERWSFYVDFGLRRSEGLNKWSQVLVRPGIIYSLNKNIALSGGFAYFNHYAFTPVRPEWRGWQQLLFSTGYGRANVAHRIRAEQRFNRKITENKLTNAYVYTNRFRYQLNVQIALNAPVIQNKTFYMTLANEIMINSGKEVKYNYFDQNRATIGFGYKLNELLNVSVAYMNVFIQKNQALQFEENNVIVVNLYHNFSRIKKNKSKQPDN